MPVRRIAALVAVIALIVAACGGDGGDAASTTAAGGGGSAGEIDAIMAGFAFEPVVVGEVPVGGTVTWTNMDGTRHTVTAGTPDEPTDAFETLELDPQASGSLTFPEAGSFAFFCEIHPSMTVTVDVS